MNSRTFRLVLTAGLSLLLLTSCAQNISPNTYTAGEVGVAAKVVPGVVLSRRPVIINANSGAGGFAGSAVGAATGASLGGSVEGNIAAAIGGAVVGGVLGNAADQALNSHRGIEYIIKLRGGNTISLVQAANVQFFPKQHVLVIYGAMTRIVADRMKS